MMPAPRLGVLAAASQRQTSRLRAIARAAVTRRAASRDPGVAYVAIESLNLWGEFSRSYYLSLIRKPIRYTRGAIAPTQSCLMGHGCPTGIADTWTDDEAIAHAINRYRTDPKKWVKLNPAPSWAPREEPAWRRANTITDLARDVAATNETDIRSSLAIATTGVFDELPTFRHFYAHRSSRTSIPATRLGPGHGIPATLRPTDILLSPPSGRPQALILEWLDDLEAIMDDLCR
jgi:hypothetical protein